MNCNFERTFNLGRELRSGETECKLIPKSENVHDYRCCGYSACIIYQTYLNSTHHGMEINR